MAAQPQGLKDLGYELQLLLGADEIVSLIEAHDSAAQSDTDRFGNLVNYFKDSVYLHARNLLNALTNEFETEIGSVPAGITSALSGRIKVSLERYVAHIKDARNQIGVTNIRGGKHLNEYVHDLTSEVRRCWKDWIDSTSDAGDKRRLQDLLDAANASAHSDRSRLQLLVKGLADACD